MMGKKDKRKWEPFRSNENSIGTYIADHKRIIMPAFLVICLLITLFIAGRAGKKPGNKEVSVNATNSGTNAAGSSESGATNGASVKAEDVVMEQDAHQDVVNLVNMFYEAQKTGDVDKIKSMSQGITQAALIRYQAASEYIDSFNNITVYTKQGPEPNSYVAYVYFEEKFKGYDTSSIPGLNSYYIRTGDNGQLYLYFGDVDEKVSDYLAQLSLQDDYVDLSNKVSVAYNGMMEAAPELEQFLTKLSAELNQNVGKLLAEQGISESNESESGESVEVANANNAASASSNASVSSSSSNDAGEAKSTEVASASGSTEASTPKEENKEESKKETKVVIKLKANDVINIRKKPDQTSEVLGKTEKDKIYNLISQTDNGWSVIEYNGSKGYVATMYFSEVKTEVAVNSNDTQAKKTDDKKSETKADSSNASNSKKTEEKADSSKETKKAINLSAGKYHVKETVRIREKASTDASVVTNAYKGEEITVKKCFADGWCEIEYNGKAGYIKTEFVEK